MPTDWGSGKPPMLKLVAQFLEKKLNREFMRNCLCFILDQSIPLQKRFLVQHSNIGVNGA
jgi:hypothetical protein